MKKILIFLVLVLGNIKAQANEPYGVLVDSTLTIYYDDLRDSREGVTFDMYKNSYFPAWYDTEYVKSITKVVFDSSIVNYRPTCLSYLFYGCSLLNEIDGILLLNTRNVTKMSEMFCKCSSLTNLDLSNFNTSNVTDMSGMFCGCSRLESLDLSGFDTSNVTKMEWMFGGCSSLTSLDLSSFNTSNVTYTDGMFSGCSSLTSLDLSNFNTSNVTGMLRMFEGCSSLTSLDLSNFNTSNVTNMKNMFYGCSRLESLDLSAFDTSKVTDMTWMFYECSSLTKLDLSNFDTSKVTDMSGMFYGCSRLESLDLGKSFTKFPENLFYYCDSISSLTTLIEEPFDIPSNCFTDNVKANATLRVPNGTVELFKAAGGWKEFVHITDGKGLDPIDKDDNADYGNGNEIDDETDLNGNIIGNIYYNISDEKGEYSSTEGCIILRHSSADDSMEGKDLFGEDLKNCFTGIIFMVQAGSGTIKVNAETVGNMTLKVKIGSSTPITMELEGKMKASFPYSVTEPTYVYIYGGETKAANARGLRAANSDNALKIYGIEWSESDTPTHVEAIRETSPSDTPVIYNLQGQRMQSTSRGINIVNGKKFIVK